MKTPIILFPGLGADHNLFLEQKKAFGTQIITPSWIPAQKNESLSQFSKRYSEHLLKNELSQFSGGFLGGFSFGGMVALELSNLFSQSGTFKVKGVLLISSGRTNSIIENSFKWKAKIAAKFPKSLLKWILKKQMLSQFIRTENLTPEQADCLKRMTAHLDMNFFQWSLLACSKWNPGRRFSSSSVGFPILEIQGEQDQIIPFSKEPGVTTLSNAKHLIQYTHPQETNQWIRKAVDFIE